MMKPVLFIFPVPKVRLVSNMRVMNLFNSVVIY